MVEGKLKASDVGMLLVFLAIPFAIGGLGALVTLDNVNGWYASIQKVPWTPPNWVFGPVWTLLYVLIGVSGWLVWRKRKVAEVRRAFGFYIAQLVLNALWTPTFFALQPTLGPAALWLAVGIIVALDALLIVTVVLFWRIRKSAALLLIPYLLWVLYASTLNVGEALLLSLGA